MKINQALKQKNKLIAKINVLTARISKNNTYIKGNVPAYDSKESLKHRIALVDELITLKSRINRAIMPIHESIIRMAELKSTIQHLRQISTQSGMINTGYGGVDKEYISSITEIERDVIIEAIEKEIEEIQDNLDQFNATNDI